MSYLRTRPLSVGYLRCFEVTARLLNFRAAADELALSQSAVSRQIQSLEDELGMVLFLRHTRSVELTEAGAVLLRTVSALLNQLDLTVQQIRHSVLRKSIAVTTFASFASMWLIPRLASFQNLHPEIDIRIDASDKPVDLSATDIDIAIRYGPASRMPTGATRLFGDQLIAVASPRLLEQEGGIQSAHDLTRFTLIEASDPQASHMDWLTWRHWFNAQGLHGVQPVRWLHFNYAYQMVQAALNGQGVVLARPPLIAESLASGELVEVLPGERNDSPMAYWLLINNQQVPNEQAKAFCEWVLAQAKETQKMTGESPAT
jgi:DNA-binding transcriptional LysR family regulator